MKDEYEIYIEKSPDLSTACEGLTRACRMKDLIIDQLFTKLEKLKKEKAETHHHLYMEGKL